MKRIFCLVCVVLLTFALVSCGGKKKDDVKIVVEEISAKTGGTISSSDNSISIEIPGDALDGDTTITMKIRENKDFPAINGGQIISKVVEFEPSGTIFKKPVLIKMTNTKNIENKIVTAAVFNEKNDAWSYSERGYAVKIKGDGGDPIMETDGGDPIMLVTAGGDPIMLNAGGDPIMMDAGGDPIMLSAAGDPIMVTADGNQMMNVAAGDPIMMTTGHFSVYTFLAIEPKGRQECGVTHTAPCTNWSNGLMWSSISADKMNWSDAGSYCENLGEEGYDTWRLPNISELRTLIQNCENSQTGGVCAVSEPGQLSSEYSSDNCACESTENNEGFYSALGDDDTVWLWSSSSLKEDRENSDYAWVVDFSSADIRFKDKSLTHSVRCVRFEPEREQEEPVSDPETEPETEPDGEPELEPDSDTEPEE